MDIKIKKMTPRLWVVSWRHMRGTDRVYMDKMFTTFTKAKKFRAELKRQKETQIAFGDVEETL